MRAGPDSVSINAWFPSTLSEVYHSLLAVELPFLRSDKLELKLSQTGAVVRSVLRALQHEQGHGRSVSKADDAHLNLQRLQFYSLEVFANGLLARYSNQTELEGELHVGLGWQLCSTVAVSNSETSLTVRRVSGSVQAFLTYARFKPALNSLLLMDYVEDILSLVAQQELDQQQQHRHSSESSHLNPSTLTPAVFIAFTLQCFHHPDNPILT